MTRAQQCDATIESLNWAFERELQTSNANVAPGSVMSQRNSPQSDAARNIKKRVWTFEFQFKNTLWQMRGERTRLLLTYYLDISDLSGTGLEAIKQLFAEYELFKVGTKNPDFCHGRHFARQ